MGVEAVAVTVTAAAYVASRGWKGVATRRVDGVALTARDDGSRYLPLHFLFGVFGENIKTTRM